MSQSNPDEYDYIFSIINENSDIVDQINDEDLSLIISQRTQQSFMGYKIFEDIYETARRLSLGIDQAIDEILNELEGK